MKRIPTKNDANTNFNLLCSLKEATSSGPTREKATAESMTPKVKSIEMLSFLTLEFDDVKNVVKAAPSDVLNRLTTPPITANPKIVFIETPPPQSGHVTMISRKPIEINYIIMINQ